MTSLTNAQHRLLATCARDGSIEVGGLDATPGVRRNVVAKLAQLRLIEYKTPASCFTESEWVITASGRALIARTTGGRS